MLQIKSEDQAKNELDAGHELAALDELHLSFP